MTESVLKNAHRVVVKVGSALVTNDGRGLDFEAIARWATQIAALQKAGKEVLLVSSGHCRRRLKAWLEVPPQAPF